MNLKRKHAVTAVKHGTAGRQILLLAGAGCAGASGASCVQFLVLAFVSGKKYFSISVLLKSKSTRT
jgi:hypothetical protein